jgi:G3E family GTPase
MEPMLVSRLRLEGVITVVDGFNGMATLDAHPEAVKQVAVADRIVLTKLDLLEGKAGEDMLFAIIARVRKLAPGARLLTTHRGEATAERLFNTGFYDPARKSPDVRNWLSLEAVQRAERASHSHQHGHGDHHHHDTSRHDDHIRSFAFTDDNPISPQALELFLELLTSYHGPNLLRMKGIVKLSDEPDRPDGHAQTRLVFIVKDIDKAAIEELFRAFTDPITGGARTTDKNLSLS